MSGDPLRILPIEGVFHTQLDAVKVVAIAVRIVITTLRILPQRVLLLKVPIFVRILIG